jgi:hypothetical protein
MPKCQAEGDVVQILFHPEATDAPEWWDVDFGYTFTFDGVVGAEELAASVAEKVNKALELARKHGLAEAWLELQTQQAHAKS